MCGGVWSFLHGNPFAPLGSLVGVNLLLMPGKVHRFVPSTDVLADLLRRWRGNPGP